MVHILEMNDNACFVYVESSLANHFENCSQAARPPNAWLGHAHVCKNEEKLLVISL